MRLGILDRVRRWARLRGPWPSRPGQPARAKADSPGRGPYPGSSPPAEPGGPAGWDSAAGRHRRPATGWPTPVEQPEHTRPRVEPAVRRPGAPPGGAGAAPVRSGSAQARVRVEPGVPVPRAAEAVRTAAAEQVAVTGRRDARRGTAWRSASPALRAKLPFTAPHARERPPTADGRRNCGSLERVLWRQWDAANPPPAEVIAAVDRLAELPERIKERLTDGLDAIFVGPGGVPELDDMTGLRGVQLPSGKASWDVCAGAYGERKIVVGSRPSPTPDVMCHEVGHALDDIDSPPGKWQSDSAEFRVLYDQCRPHFASDFHRQPGGLGRKEFFADAFAAIASGQRPALVDMLGGETRTALRVMLYFNRRYDI
jgi:hypothetical protein